MREDLSRLNAEVDALRTNLADRFDAIPAPDLEPMLAELAALEERIDAIRPTDLAPVLGLLALLGERIDAAATADLSPIEERLAQLDQLVKDLPGPDTLAGALAGPLEALHERDRTDEVLQALTGAATAMREQISALPDPAATLESAIEPIRADLDGLSTASAGVRTDLTLVTEVLAALTQLAESSDERLTALSEAQEATATDQKTAVSQTLGELTQRVTGQVQQVESQLVQLVTRTASLDDVQQGLARMREAVAALTTKADRADEASKEQADGQSLALARLTATADGLASAIGTARASISEAVESSRDAAIEAVDERVGTRIEQALQQAEAERADQMQLALADLGITQLRRSVADVTAQVVAGRTDARTINESIAALEARVAQATGDAVRPMTGAIDHIRKQIESIPAPDLGPVAAQLARLNATIASQARDDATAPAEVTELRTSMEDAFAAVRDQLTDQVEMTAQLQAYMASRAGPAEIVEDLRHELGRSHAALQANLDRLAADVTAAREAAERRPVSRWRRGSDDGAGGQSSSASSSEPSELEQRIDRALQDVDERLASLAQLVERAGAFADDAAQAAVATLKVVSSPKSLPPPPASPPASSAPTKKAAAKRTPAKKAPAKKAAAKKTPAKKAASTKKSATRATGTAKAAAPAKKTAKRAEP